MGIFDDIAEHKIQADIACKAFENLEGMDKPVGNCECFSLPAAHRMTFHILKNGKIQPEEMELKKNIVQINALIREAANPEERSELFLKRSELFDKLDIMLEKNKLHKQAF
jgi:hypothetical protein